MSNQEFPPRSSDQADVLENKVSNVETPKVLSEQEKLAAEAMQQQKGTEKITKEEKEKIGIWTKLGRTFNTEKAWKNAPIAALEKHAEQVFKNPGGKRKMMRYQELKNSGDLDRAKAFLIAISAQNYELPDEKTYDDVNKRYTKDTDTGGTFGQ
ncbi:MAG TPA: hypothetical protein PLO44_00415 [Candidatus Paceibacterota bacterium]|nr:hypothetical protein [Candidatus Paceibacterota bacterium]